MMLSVWVMDIDSGPIATRRPERKRTEASGGLLNLSIIRDFDRPEGRQGQHPARYRSIEEEEGRSTMTVLLELFALISAGNLRLATRSDRKLRHAGCCNEP